MTTKRTASSPVGATEAKARDRQQHGRDAPEGFLRPQQFAQAKHMGINQVYQAVKNGSLAHVRIGKTIFIATDAIERLLARPGAA